MGGDPDLTPETRGELREVARALADAAAAETLRFFRSPGLDAADKAAGDPAARFDPVTEADRAAERAMRAALRRLRPGDGVLGEEYEATASKSGLTWVLDPIDGTRAYLSGAPTWGTLIAVDAGAGPVLGVIDQPFIGERFLGGFGAAELADRAGVRPIATRTCAGLPAAILYTTFPEIGAPAERSGFETVRDRVRLTRYGLDCYAYAMLAMGAIDLVIEAGLQAYDIQAPQAVIEAAGGIVTDWRGGSPHGGGRVLAAGDARVHAEALEILRRVAD